MPNQKKTENRKQIEKLENKPSESQKKIGDVPPKPPPRTFPVLEIPKKETDVLKSATLTEDQSKPTAPEPVATHFEFPEVLKPASLSNLRPPLPELVNENNLKNFEPKIVSTPTSKNEKIDFPENETSVVKSCSIAESSRTAGENKVSPSNSVVRAMIYTTKNKSGNKKKNTLIASK